MALPKLNENPQYELTIPSTGKTISYRPYLVKEEKVLMIAFESGDVKQAIKAIHNTLDSCIVDEIDLSKLATFDVEYIFTQVRSKSVGEKATVVLSCDHCENKNDYTFDISNIEVDISKESNNKVELVEGVFVEMRYPRFSKVLTDIGQENGVQDGFNTVVASIDAIVTEDERFKSDDLTWSELETFVEGLTTNQFSKLLEFLKSIPQIKHEAKFTCDNCNEENTVVLSGLRDFL